jgi:hypothetical protein
LAGLRSWGLTAVVLTGTDSTGGSRPDPPAGTETIAVDSAEHVAGDVEYSDVAPAGGAHDSRPLACGYYDFVVPDESVVHSLEHGVVWVTYEQGMSDQEVDILKDRGRSRETIVSLLPDQGSAITGTAWGHEFASNQPITLDSSSSPMRSGMRPHHLNRLRVAKTESSQPDPDLCLGLVMPVSVRCPMQVLRTRAGGRKHRARLGNRLTPVRVHAVGRIESPSSLREGCQPLSSFLQGFDMGIDFLEMRVQQSQYMATGRLTLVP